MKTERVPGDLILITGDMLDLLAWRLCRMIAFYLGAACRHFPHGDHPRWLACERQAKLRLLCELRMLFEGLDLPKPADRK